MSASSRGCRSRPLELVVETLINLAWVPRARPHLLLLLRELRPHARARRPTGVGPPPRARRSSRARPSLLVGPRSSNPQWSYGRRFYLLTGAGERRSESYRLAMWGAKSANQMKDFFLKKPANLVITKKK
jgi:hypothetical protein